MFFAAAAASSRNLGARSLISLLKHLAASTWSSFRCVTLAGLNLHDHLSKLCILFVQVLPVSFPDRPAAAVIRLVAFKLLFEAIQYLLRLLRRSMIFLSDLAMALSAWILSENSSGFCRRKSGPAWSESFSYIARSRFLNARMLGLIFLCLGTRHFSRRSARQAPR
jgi:hypothetical protein